MSGGTVTVTAVLAPNGDHIEEFSVAFAGTENPYVTQCNAPRRALVNDLASLLRLYAARMAPEALVRHSS